MKTYTFAGFIEQDSYQHSVALPEDIFEELTKAGIKRVLIQFAESEPKHLGLHSRNGIGMIWLSKGVMKENDLLPFEDVKIQIMEDDSKYQAPEPDVWFELMDQEPELRSLFDRLTVGKQRSILFAIDRPVSVDAQLRQALKLADKLKDGSLA